MKEITLKEACKAAKKATCRISKKDKKRYKESKKFYKKNGFYFEDSWNLDASIAAFILPRLVQLRDVGQGCPSSLVNNDKSPNQNECHIEWRKILNTMINGYYLYCTKEHFDWKEKDFELWRQTKQLTMQYYESLWD
jgi:hypothetical protein